MLTSSVILSSATIIAQSRTAQSTNEVVALTDEADRLSGLHEYEKAFRLYREAAKSGWHYPQSIISSMYAVGKGAPQDWKRSLMWKIVANRKEPNKKAELTSSYVPLLTVIEIKAVEKAADICVTSQFVDCMDF